MARNVTLTTVSTLALQRADAESDQHIGSSELTGLVNLALSNLWDELVAAAPPHYYLTTSASVALTAGTTSYSLSTDFSISDFYKLSRAQVSEQNGHWRSLLPMDPNQAVILTSPASATVRLEYIPTAPTLVSGSDTFDGVNGWEELVALWVALKIYAKKNLDPSSLLQHYGAELDRVRRMAPRDWGTPGRIQRMSLRKGAWPWATNTLTHYRLRGADALEFYRGDPMWSSP